MAMVTGAAPIDPKIQNALKVIFGCNIQQGYG